MTCRKNHGVIPSCILFWIRGGVIGERFTREMHISGLPTHGATGIPNGMDSVGVVWNSEHVVMAVVTVGRKDLYLEKSGKTSRVLRPNDQSTGERNLGRLLSPHRW